jgi:hypothetical protein
MKILIALITLLTPFITPAQFIAGGMMPDYNNAPVRKIKLEYSFKSTIISRFDDSSRIIDEKHYTPKGLIKHERYIYWHHDSILFQRDTPLYNKSKHVYFFENRFHYNRSKQIIKIECFIGPHHLDTPMTVSTYTYYQGLIHTDKFTARSSNGTIDTGFTSNTYDQQKHLVQSTSNGTPVGNCINTKVYNSEGHLIEEIITMNSKPYSDYTFEKLDSYGNWRECYEITDKGKRLSSTIYYR